MKAPTLPTHFGNVYVSPIGPRDRQFGVSPIEYKISYINNLPEEAIVVLRSGIKFTVPRQHLVTCDTLVIRVEIMLRHSAKNEIQRLLSTVNEESSSELKAMREAFTIQLRNNNTHSGLTLILDYTITPDDLRKMAGTFYHNELDCVISISKFNDTPPHPHSDIGRQQTLLNNKNVSEVEGSFNYIVELVDNTNAFGPRYLNVGNKIYKVDTTKDSTRKDGAYVISNHPVTGELVNCGIDSKYYTFEELEEKLGLFRTAEEAKHLDDVMTSRKLELAKLEFEAGVTKTELQNLKHIQDMRTLEREKELSILAMEKESHAAELLKIREKAEHDLKMEREYAKARYDDRSYDRKDSSEIFKWIPGIIVAIGAIAVAFNGSK